MSTRKNAKRRVPDSLSVFLVLVALIVTGLHGVAAKPVAAQSRAARLDLPAIALTPADLAQAGLAGFGIASVDAANSGWRSLGDAAADSVAGNGSGIGNPALLSQLDFELSHAGWQRQYRRLLAQPDAAAPDRVNISVSSEVAEYAGNAGADAALTFLTNGGKHETAGNAPVGDRVEIRRDVMIDAGSRLVVEFRDGKLLGIVSIVQYGGTGEPALAPAMILARQLQARIDTAIAHPGPGLSGVALRLATVASPAEFEVYWRLGGETYADYGETPEHLAAASASFGDALAVYQLRYTLAAPLNQKVAPLYTIRLLRFPNDAAASAWLGQMPKRIADDVANSGGKLAADPLANASRIGDESLTYAVKEESDGVTTHGYRIYTRVGADVARVQFDAVAGPPLAVLAMLATAQADCLKAGSCDVPVQLPRDLAGLNCPPAPKSAARPGAQSGPGPAGAPRELWQLTAPGTAPRGPVVAGGVLYAGSSTTDPDESTRRNLFAVDAATGRQRWCVTTGMTPAEPAVADGLVFTSGEALSGGHQQTFVVALAAATGIERWRFDVGLPVDTFAAEITPAGGTVYVGTPLGALFALDEATGQPRWLFRVDPEAGLDQWILSSPAIADGVVYVTGGQNVYAIDAGTGAVRWHVDAGAEEQLGAPAIAGGVVYIGGRHAVYAFDAKSGKQVWRFAAESAEASRIAVANHVLYVGTGSEAKASGTAFFAAVDATSGRQLWRLDAKGYVTTPTVVGGVVHVGNGVKGADGRSAGAVFAVAATDGRVLWSYPVAGLATTPTGSGGQIYVASETVRNGAAVHTIYAIRAETGR